MAYLTSYRGMLGSTDSYSDKDSPHSVPPTGASVASPASHSVPASSTSRTSSSSSTSSSSTSCSSAFPPSSDSKQPNHTNASSNDRRNPSNKHIGRQLPCARLLYDCNWNSADHVERNANENREKKNEISRVDDNQDHNAKHCSMLVHGIPSATPLSSSSVDIAGKRKRSTADDTDNALSSDDIPYKKDDKIPDTVDRKLQCAKREICSMASTLWGLGFVERVEEWEE
jgi:hypothetical protein